MIENTGAIDKDIYRALGLRDEDYRRIIRILGREPSPTELAMFSVEWSEHCGYSRSRSLLKKLPRKGRYRVLIGEDSGGIVMGDSAIVFKMESHNHPSQLEPKQGAATGVGGIIRDIFTAGARPIASLNSLRFGPLSEPYNRYLLKGVVDGIQFYGNCLGVPTVGGEVYFDESYSGNCLVNAMSIGIARKDKLARARAQGAGNSIIYVGSSTGRDGIGGCSVLASQEFGEGDEKRPSVQIGDPFTEKCLIEATLEALSRGGIVGIKDMGAAGLTCSISEMAFDGKAGIDADLDKVPRREEGMEPWEVMMSESQERMLVCVKKGREDEVMRIFHKWDLNAVRIGEVTGEKVVRIRNKGRIVAEIPPDALADAPIFKMSSKRPAGSGRIKRLNARKLPVPEDLNKVFTKLISSPTIASKEWIYRQYDHMVQAKTISLPGSDAAVLRLEGTKKGIAAATDCNGLYCYLDPYRGAQIAVSEAARNIACSGAEPAAVTDCLNFGNPDKEETYWYFENAVKGIADSCRFFGIPVVSGNVSFYNESPKGPVYPTPAIGMIGIIDDTARLCTRGFKNEDDIIILFGETKEELGASEYLKEIHGVVRGPVPEINLEREKRIRTAVLECIKKGYLNSAHDCSEGGLAVAVAESCFGDGRRILGAVIDNLKEKIRLDALLFGESQSRVIASANKIMFNQVRKIAEKEGAPVTVIGRAGGRRLSIFRGQRKVVDVPVKSLYKTWSLSIEKRLERGS